MNPNDNSFQRLANSDALESLKTRGALAEEVRNVSKRLTDIQCDWEETQHLRGWLDGVNAVFRAIEMEAAKEQFPDTAGKEPRTLSEFGGWAAATRARHRHDQFGGGAGGVGGPKTMRGGAA